jgi:hypothetical protein
MTSIKPTSTGPVAVHPTYTADNQARAFWRLSFRTGRDYIRGRDSLGMPVLIEHEREEAVSYARRLRTTKPRNYTGPIIRKYNDMVFRKPPTRDADADEFWSEFWEDCDGRGTSMDTFMSNALVVAQVERETYIVPDVMNPVASDLATVAAITEAGTRPIVVRVDAGAVVNWTDDGGVLAEVVMLWVVADGTTVLRWWGKETRQDAIINQQSFTTGQIVITGFEPEIPHGYDRMPVVRLRPNLDPLGAFGTTCGDSQAGPLAESQQAITNLLSLLNEEISNVTFSQMIASGVSEDQVKDVQVGNSRILCLPNPAAKVDMIGADPAQATSIRTSMQDEVDNLLRSAGVVQGDATAQSGTALAFRHNDMATIVAALGTACAAAENNLDCIIGDAWGQEEPAPVVYECDETGPPDFAAESDAMVRFVSSTTVPTILRVKVAERFASRNLSMDNDDMEAMRAEMMKDKGDQTNAQNGNPFPPKKFGAVKPTGDDAAADETEATDDDTDPKNPAATTASTKE